jgi:hypothetical protein
MYAGVLIVAGILAAIGGVTGYYAGKAVKKTQKRRR